MRAGRIEQEGTPEEVFDHPANAFVMDFLGHVNVFHGRVQAGRATLGGLELAYPDYPHGEPRAAALYVRPHELELHGAPNGSPAITARVLHLSPAGPVTRVQLVAGVDERVIHADVSHTRRSELDLKAGDTVYVSPRQVRVFVPDYTI